MSLAERAVTPPAPPLKGPKCEVCRAVQHYLDEGGAELDALRSMLNWPLDAHHCRAIADALNSEGFRQVNATNVRRHRKRECVGYVEC